MLFQTSRTPYSTTDRDRIGVPHAEAAREILRLHPAFAETPLLPLASLAAELGVAAVQLKAESGRMGLGSFKPLGGIHAVGRLIQARAAERLNTPVRPADLTSAAVRRIAGEMVFACASAGNHGMAVAAAARLFGAEAVVYLSDTVPASFADRLARQGARVERFGADYEASMAEAAAASARNGWQLVSDSSWAGYTAVPLDIMRGYTVLFDEAAAALERSSGPASHDFDQAGVGGLAAAAAGYLRDRWGEQFKLIVVEPDGAACLGESARHGRALRIRGAPTVLGRLDCKEPSLVGFDLLARLADGFMTVSDAAAADAAARIAAKGAPTSPCGATGAAGLFRIAADPAARTALGLDARSRVLLIGSETANP